jgi:tetratricopeptide (TPR) repeat protein
VRINAQLIQVSDQTQLWGDSYTRDLSDVFAVQAEVAEAVAKALAVELLPQDELAKAAIPTTSSAAYDAYLLGRSYWAKRTSESLYTAIDHFKRAIEFDPTYALAYAGLADTWGVLPYYTTGPYQEMNAEASKAAVQALELDDSLAEAHVSMALVSGNRCDFTEAFEHYRKAVEIDPNNATAHQWYGLTLCLYGRADEGLAELEHGVALDPASAVMHLDFGSGYHASHRFGSAIDQYKKALELQPALIPARHSLVWAYIGQGRTDDAAEAFEDFLRVLGLREADVSRFRLDYAESGFCDATTSWLASYQGKTEDVNLDATRRDRKSTRLNSSH